MQNNDAHPELEPEVDGNVAKEKPFDVVGFIMDVAGGEVGSEELIEGVQHMIDSGIVWQLEGAWGRLAASLIEKGHCHR